MKTFIYSEQKRVVSRMYGGATVTSNIYRLKNNVPHFITQVKWCTRAYRGADSEVMIALIKAGELPKTCGNYYYQSEDKVKIYGV
jgi:hypothetical protein